MSRSGSTGGWSTNLHYYCSPYAREPKEGVVLHGHRQVLVVAHDVLENLSLRQRIVRLQRHCLQPQPRAVVLPVVRDRDRVVPLIPVLLLRLPTPFPLRLDHRKPVLVDLRRHLLLQEIFDPVVRNCVHFQKVLLRVRRVHRSFKRARRLLPLPPRQRQLIPCLHELFWRQPSFAVEVLLLRSHELVKEVSDWFNHPK